MLAVIIAAVAFILRAHNLELFPINHDEANWTIPSTVHFDSFLGFPVSCFRGYIQPSFSWLFAISKRMFFIPEQAVRIPAALIGAATVFLVYLLAKEMYGRRSGIIAATFLCFLPWHILQSRIGVSLILTPFFGALIAFSLMKCARIKSAEWFYLFCIFLSWGAFYSYQASLVFLPVFAATAAFLRKELCWLKRKRVLIGIALFFIVVYPLIHLYFQGRIPEYLGKIYRMLCQDKSFCGSTLDFLAKPAINIKRNLVFSFKGLFFAQPFILYGQAMHHPLLLHWITLVAVIASLIVCFRERQAADKMLLVWFILGYFSSIAAVRFCADRYYFTVIVVPAIILLARFCGVIFKLSQEGAFWKRMILNSLGFGFVPAIVSIGILQWSTYYYAGPIDLEECRFNSYGCKEAALYLSRMPKIENSYLRASSLMEPLGIYLGYYLYGNIDKKLNQDREKAAIIYNLIWAPETHPADYRSGYFNAPYVRFMAQYPDAQPEKVIYYPDGQPAIRIYKNIGHAQ